jgi:cytochrome c553
MGVITVLAMSVAGCVNPERSRDLANPAIDPAVTAAQVCSVCHGRDGNSVSPNFPRLAGQKAEYLEEQLKNFRSRQRMDPEGYEYMWGVSRNLTDAQIAGLAQYFSRQAPQANPAAGKAPGDAGKAIFENGIPEKQVTACQACHGPKGEGLGTFPRLAGQHQDYMAKQLLVFRDTEGRPGTPMKQITHNLERNDVIAVTYYIEGMPVN